MRDGRGGFKGYRGKGKFGCGRGNFSGRGISRNSMGNINRNSGHNSGSGDNRKVDMSLRCDFCNMRGHLRDQCFKELWYKQQKISSTSEPTGNHSGGGTIAGQHDSGAVVPFDHWRNSRNQRSSSYSSYVACVVYFAATISAPSPNVWMLDSCCNACITPFKQRLQGYVEFDHDKFVVGFGGSTSVAKGTGSVTLVDEYGRRHDLDDVLYIPEAQFPIMPMMKVRRQGFDVTFLGERSCWLSVKSGGFSLQGTAIDDILYIRDYARGFTTQALAVETRRQNKRSLESTNDEVPDENENDEESLDRSCQRPHLTRISNPTNVLWHLRFCHASSSVLAKLGIKTPTRSADCSHCIMAKQHKLPHHPVEERATEKLEIVHSDICGKFVPSIGKSRYFVTCTDDLTRFKWVLPIRNRKSQTLYSVFDKWIHEVERETGLSSGT